MNTSIRKLQGKEGKSGEGGRIVGRGWEGEEAFRFLDYQ